MVCIFTAECSSDLTNKVSPHVHTPDKATWSVPCALINFLCVCLVSWVHIQGQLAPFILYSD